MTNIYIQAYNAHKPTKQSAADYIAELYDHPALTDQRAELAALYKYFIPAAPRKPRTAFDWLWLATVPHGECRAYLHFIWCDGAGNAVATNGNALHKAPCDKPEGFYDREGHKIEHGHTFPDWQRLFKPTMLGEQHIITGFEPASNETYCMAPPSSFNFDMKLLDKTLSMGGEYTMHWSGKRDPLLINFEDGRQALVIPRI